MTSWESDMLLGLHFLFYLHQLWGRRRVTSHRMTWRPYHLLISSWSRWEQWRRLSQAGRRQHAWQINLANEFRYHKFTHMYMQCLINHHCPSIKYIDLMSLAVDVLNDTRFKRLKCRSSLVLGVLYTIKSRSFLHQTGFICFLRLYLAI
jgi:hypothetical protein